MNSKDYIEVNRTQYSKSEACEWDAHSYCSGYFDGPREIKKICICSCHDVNSTIIDNGTGNVLITNLKVPKEY